MTRKVENHSKETATVRGRPLKVADRKQLRGEVEVSGQRSVFEYTDYREYLRDAYQAKKNRNPAFSESAFCRKAGLGKNSRGYLKMIVDGKRNLTPNTIRGFSEALGLDGRETLYFENLVYFNQAKKAKDKEYYFARLSASAEGNETKPFLLMKSQHSFYSQWYLVAIRELVGLTSFEEDLGWIVAQLRGKINRRQAKDALMHLERLRLIERNDSGKLVQAEPLLKYEGGQFNYTIQKFHTDMLERAQETLADDEYGEYLANCVTVSCDYDRIDEMKERIISFRQEMNRSFGLGSKQPDTVFQIGLQMFQLTPQKKKGR